MSCRVTLHIRVQAGLGGVVPTQVCDVCWLLAVVGCRVCPLGYVEDSVLDDGLGKVDGGVLEGPIGGAWKRG